MVNNAPHNQHLKKPVYFENLRYRKNRTALRQSTTSEAVAIFLLEAQSRQQISSLYQTVPPPVACAVNQSATPNHPCVHKQHIFSPETEPTIPKL